MTRRRPIAPDVFQPGLPLMATEAEAPITVVTTDGKHHQAQQTDIFALLDATDDTTLMEKR